MSHKNPINLIKTTFREWSDDNASSLAAALAYYTSFSLAPLLVIVIAIAGLFGGSKAVHNLVMSQVGNLLGPDGAEFISSMIENANQPSTGILATIIGVITLLLGALGVFGELQKDLNRIWEVKPRPIKGFINTVWHYVVKRVISFTMLMVIAFLLLVSLVVSAALAALGTYIGNTVAFSDATLLWINIIISIILITLLFAVLYKYLPDAKIRWRDVLLGAFITAILFSMGKFAISLYLGRSNVSTAFGAAGSLAILLIWVYYSAQILFLGAEFTQVYANMYGSRIVTDEDAMPMKDNEQIGENIPHSDEENKTKLHTSKLDSSIPRREDLSIEE